MSLDRRMLVLGVLGWGVVQTMACDRAPDATPRKANPCAGSQYCLKYGACQVATQGGLSAGEESEPSDSSSNSWLNPATNPHGRVDRDRRGFELNVGTTCVARKNADCRRSIWSCRLRGRCTASNGRCVAETDADCEQSYRCRRDGWCTARGGGCVAGSDADCEASEVCDLAGRCDAYGDFCTYSDEERRKMVRAFAEDASRSLSDPTDRPYFSWYRQDYFESVLPSVPPSDVEDSTREPSSPLRPSDLAGGDERGSGGAGPAGGAPSIGSTGRVGDASEVDRNADGGTGNADTYSGDTRMRDTADARGATGGGRLLPPCSERKGCLHRGRCGRSDGECVPTRDSHCRESHACLFFGHCTAEKPSDGRASPICDESPERSSYRRLQRYMSPPKRTVQRHGEKSPPSDLSRDELIFRCRHVWGLVPDQNGDCVPFDKLEEW